MVSLVIPKKGYLLDCGNCGQQHWKIAVLPQNDGAKIAKIQCINCKHEYAIDVKGNIGGWLSGKQDIVAKKQIEHAQPNGG